MVLLYSLFYCIVWYIYIYIVYRTHILCFLHTPFITRWRWQFNQTSSYPNHLSSFLMLRAIHRVICPPMHSGRRPRECVNECVDIYVCDSSDRWSNPFFSISLLYPPLIYGRRLPSFLMTNLSLRLFHTSQLGDSCLTDRRLNKKNMVERGSNPRPPS